MYALLKASCCLVALAPLLTAQQNPFDTPDGIAQGGALFQTHCAYCHGARGEGGRGADLTTGQYRRGGSDAEIFSTIRNGIPGTEMPTVRATDEEVWKLVAFVKKIGSSGLSEKATGDAVAGRAIFEGKARCASCHSIRQDGGSFGPDLSDIGRRRNLKYLEESLVSPEADIPIRYRAVQVILKTGQTVAGIRLNEDDLSIQIRDADDKLRSFLKINVAEVRRDQPSSMPSYRSILTRKELDDIVSYLSSLRGGK